MLRIIDENDPFTHPPVGSWVCGEKRIAYQVIRRRKIDGKFYVIVAHKNKEATIPLSAIVHWSEKRFYPDKKRPADWLPEIGETVHKRHYQGWRGEVVELLEGGKVRVQWWYDPMASILNVDDLRPWGTEAEGKRFEWQQYADKRNKENAA